MGRPVCVQRARFVSCRGWLEAAIAGRGQGAASAVTYARLQNYSVLLAWTQPARATGCRQVLGALGAVIVVTLLLVDLGKLRCAFVRDCACLLPSHHHSSAASF